MSYQKHIWVSGEIIRKPLLDHIEDGIFNEEQRAVEVETQLETDLSEEVTRARNQEILISANLAQENARALSVEGTLSNAISAEESRAILAESDLHDYVDEKVSTTYKASGSIFFADLPPLAASRWGNVYNIKDAFTTTNDFIEGAGKDYPAGTNVAIIGIGSESYNEVTPEGDENPSEEGWYEYDISEDEYTLSEDTEVDEDKTYYELVIAYSYYYDVLSGFIDLSPYAEKADLADVATSGDYSDLINKPSIPTKTSDLTNDSNFAVDANYVHTDNNYTTAEKDKLAGIEAGAEVNVQSDWNQTTSSADDFIKNKPSIPSKTSDLTNDSNFVTDTDYATTSSAGVVKPDGTTTSVNANGVISVIGGVGGGHTIVNSSGTALTQRANLKFQNATVTDDAVNDTTIVTPSGGGGGDMAKADYDPNDNVINAGGIPDYVDDLLPTNLSDLSDDATHRLVTDTEKTAWNNKVNADDTDYLIDADSVNGSTGGGFIKKTLGRIVSYIYELARSYTNSLSSSLTTASYRYIRKSYNTDSSTSYTDMRISPYRMKYNATLSTSTTTTVTFTNSNITTESVVSVYTSIYGINPSSVSVANGSCTIVFPKYTSAASMSVVLEFDTLYS